MIQKTMKWVAIAAVASVISCTNKESSVSDISDNYSGQYICKSMQFLDSPIDINGDGTATTDLLSEYSTLGFTEDVIKTHFAISSAKQYNEDIRCHVRIPMQDVTYYKISDEYTTNEMGNDAIVCFSYYVDLSGQVVFVLHNESNTNIYYSNEYEEHYLDYKYLGIQSIKANGDGVLRLVIKNAFYDYCTNTFIEGLVESVYERVSCNY